MLWVFEDAVKKRYASFTASLSRLLQDPETNIKSKALSILYNLLTHFPEGERTLLTLLVNTLGDPVKKIASRAIYFLQTLLSEHPTMVTVVVKEVQQLLFRPNIKLRAQAYAITFLTQIEFNSRMQDVASRLVALYFDFFKVRNTEVERERLSQGSRVRVRD